MDITIFIISRSACLWTKNSLRHLVTRRLFNGCPSHDKTKNPGSFRVNPHKCQNRIGHGQHLLLSQYSLYFQHKRACPDVEPLAEGTALAILGRNCQTKRYRAQTGPLCIATQALRAWLL